MTYYFDEDDYCDHDCSDGCWEYGDGYCHHEHYCHCGTCGCPGYCDDYQTYNLRPAETGGAL